MMLGNFYIAFKLRDLQNIGTSYKFVFSCLATYCVSAILNLIGAFTASQTDYVWSICGYLGFTFLQVVTCVLLCSVRQNSLSNYKRLPVWLVTLGALF